MSGQIQPVGPATPPSAAAQSQMANVVANNSAGAITGATHINSMADLKNKSPKLYKSMMQGIAGNMISQMQNQENQLEALMREGRDSG